MMLLLFSVIANQMNIQYSYYSCIAARMFEHYTYAEESLRFKFTEVQKVRKSIAFLFWIGNVTN